MKDGREHRKGRRSLMRGLMALVVALVMIILPSVYSQADLIDLSKPVSLTVEPGSDEDFNSDLEKANVVLDIYKIAGAQKVDGYDTYEYVLVKNADGTEDTTYGSLFSKDPVSISNHDITSEQWDEVAQKAAAIALGTASGASAQTPEIKGGSLETANSLSSPGLYLVVPRGSTIGATDYVTTSEAGEIVTIARSSMYEYTFKPQLIGIPARLDPETGENMTSNNNIDWDYNPTILLKADREIRKSSIEIVKKLDQYETKDPATFVFHVYDTATKGTVYDDYFSIVFDEPSSRSGKAISIDDLPAGLSLTVEEVYYGGKYTLTTSNEQEVTVDASTMNQVEFTNTYDDTYKGGGSITNTFTNDTVNGWQWEGVDDDGNKYTTDQ